MKTLARVAAMLLAVLSVAGVALALQAAFGFGQSGANFGERAGNVAGQRVERFMSAAEAQLELEGASDQSTARGPRQRLDGEGGGNFLGAIGGFFLVGGIMVAVMEVERRIVARRRAAKSAIRVDLASGVS